MSIVNQTVPRALKFLGYTPSQVDDIVAYIADNSVTIGAPHLKDEHQAVFSCAIGENAIHYIGHVKMMAAVQPFLSGAISKTINMPEEATVEDVEQLHIDSWQMGLKAVAIYRDNCKVAQPLSSKKKQAKAETEPAETVAAEVKAEAEKVALPADRILVKGAIRRRLPHVRNSRTYRFEISDLKGYFIVGQYDDGAPGELFINVSKQGSTLSGLMDSFAISVSHGLQYGVPIKSYIKTLMSSSFAPSGITDDKDIRTASSITDYIMRRLAMDYLSFDDRLELGLASLDDLDNESQTSLLIDDKSTTASEIKETIVDSVIDFEAAALEAADQPAPKPANALTAPMCYNCGNQTQRAGSCYVCSSCGSTTGCS